MAITWGSIISSGTSSLRVGIDIDITTASDSSPTVRSRFYVWTKYGVSDSSNTFKASGSWGSTNKSISLSTSVSSGAGWSTSNQKLVHTESQSFTRNYGSARTLSASCSLTGIDVVGASKTASASKTFTLSARPYAKPAAPSAVSHTRDSDNQNTVRWTRNATTGAPYGSILIERAYNGGEWAQFATVSGTATSYVNSGTIANRSYRYRVRAKNTAGYSAYSAATAWTYNTPAAPKSVVATLTGVTSAVITWDKNSNTSNRTYIERRVGSGAWEPRTWTASESYTDASVPAGVVSYRVRNSRDGVLFSGYSAASNTITTIQKPNAPTLNPTASIIEIADSSVRFSWTHNSKDGSAQSRYQAEIAGTTYDNVSGAQYIDVPIEALGTGSKSWRVRTWGLHHDPSDWSGLLSFNVIAPPSINILSPASDGDIVGNMPFDIEWDYTDAHGSQSATTLRIAESGSGKVVYEAKRTGSLTSLSIDATDVLFEDGVDYEITLIARSTSSLEVSAKREFSVAYIKPATPDIYVMVDDGSASAAVTVYEGVDDGAPDTALLAIYRISDGATHLVASRLSDGDTVLDRTPPVGRAFAYKAIALSATGAVAENTSEEHSLDIDEFIINFGLDFEQEVRLRWQVNYSNDHDSGQTLTQFEGRENPVVFNSTVRSVKASLSAVVIDQETLDGLKALASWGKRAYLRTPTGDSFACAVSVKNDLYGFRHKKAQTSLEITRLDEVIS